MRNGCTRGKEPPSVSIIPMFPRVWTKRFLEFLEEEEEFVWRARISSNTLELRREFAEIVE